MKFKKILVTFVLLTCLDYLVWKFVWNDERSIYQAMSSGLFFSLFWLIPIKTKKEVDEQFLRESGLELSENEKLMLGSTANQISGGEVIGGRLFLTDQRLVFIANKSHNQKEFDRTQIISVQRHSEYPKAIVIVTKESTHAFNVDKHAEWMRELKADKK